MCNDINITDIDQTFDIMNCYQGWEFDSLCTKPWPSPNRCAMNVNDVLGIHNIDVTN